MKEDKEIELLSDEIKEIIGYIPKKIIRFGSLFILIIFICLIIASWIIKYPDIIKAPIEITSDNLPMPIISNISGKIDTIYIQNDDFMEKGELIALISSDLDYNDFIITKKNILSLKKELNSATEKEILHLADKTAEINYNLGKLKIDYLQLINSVKEYNIFVQSEIFDLKKQMIHKKISKLKQLKLEYSLQNQIEQKRSTIERGIFSRDSVAYKKKLLSSSNFEKSKIRIINQKISIKNLYSKILKLDISIIDLENVKLELIYSRNLDLERRTLKLKEKIESCLTKYLIWKEQHSLIAPVTGNIEYLEYWHNNQIIKKNEVIFYLIPESKSSLVGKIKLPIIGAGKIKKNQKINIKLFDYSYTEFGVINGIVKKKSSIHNNKYYIVDVEFPNKLETSYKKDIKPSARMNGTAEIITNDISLLERFYSPLKSIINR